MIGSGKMLVNNGSEMVESGIKVVGK